MNIYATSLYLIAKYVSILCLSSSQCIREESVISKLVIGEVFLRVINHSLMAVFS